MWYDTNPYEVGMGYDWMVDLEQGSDFIGKEALARIKQEGAKRKLVGVEIGGEPLGAYNDGAMVDFFGVDRDGERIGKVTSACFSPRLEKKMRLGVIDQLLDRTERRIGRHHHDVLGGRDPHDRLEVLERVEAFHRRERHVNRQHLPAEVERIAVRRRLRRGGGADIAAGAGAVLHEHRLAPGFAQLLRHDAAERIDGAAGGERDDDAHGAVGVGSARMPSHGSQRTLPRIDANAPRATATPLCRMRTSRIPPFK